MPNKNPPQEVYKILVSLLISRQDPASLAVIDNDYYEMEGEHIPWRKYGYGSIIEFFKNKPEYFQILRNNGVICIRGIASDKSKHVDSLVSRQKKNSTKGSHISSRNRPTLYTSYVRHRPKIPAEQLNTLVQYVQNSSEGVNINSALLMIQKQLPYVKLTEYDLRDQLRELGHQLYLEGDVIYSMERSNMVPRVDISSYRPQSLSSKPLYNASEPSTSNAMYTVPEEYPDFMDDDDFVRPNSAQYHLGQLKTDERIASSLKEHSNYGQTFNYYNYNVEEESSVEKYGDIETSEYSTDLETTEGKSSNLTNLISNKTRLRLEKLIQKYPKGIRCSELPELYMKEYKMPLNYADLGFNSVPSFVSYLPNIFYLTRENTNDDFMLYSANKRQADDNKNYSEETSKDCTETTSKTKPISVPNSQPEPNETDDDDAPFPLDMSPGLLNKFAPDDVTTYEDISHILVTDLQQSKKQYLEVYVVEVFTPSFFWIHLRKNTKPFEMFMNDLKNFYQQCHQSYSVPKLALKRGLNCACIYCGTWHRAVIKTVKPDFRVTVMFYDYGTQKTYAPEDIYYLNKRFSYLPAQAIPCGLYNVKPYIGDRWKKSITDRFIDKISDSVLAANIVSIDPPNNSMLIILTDTSEEEDVHINDWLVQENLARCGKMGDAVDMASLPKYVVNCKNKLPTYCYAEENLMFDSCNKSTATEELKETPLVSSGASCTYRDNYLQPCSRAPGFAPINEHFDQFNSPTNCHHTNVYSTLGNAAKTKTPPVFSDVSHFTERTNNPLLDVNPEPSAMNATSDDTFHNKVEKQMFINLLQESLVLQIHLTGMFRQLLSSQLAKNKISYYTTMLFQINNTLGVLANEVERQLVSNPPQNWTNNVRPSSKASQVNSNCENLVHQETTNSTRSAPSVSTSSTVNPLELYKKWQDAESSLPNIRDLFHQDHANNRERILNHVCVNSHEAGANSPHIRSPSVISCDPKPLMINGHGTDKYWYLKQQMDKLPVLNTTDYVGALNTNSSNYRHNADEFVNACSQNGNTCKNEELTKLKETNPFRNDQNIEAQTPVTQSEKNIYDAANFTSYPSDGNLQSHTPTVDVNVRQTDCYKFYETDEADYKFRRTNETNDKSCGTNENIVRNEPNYVSTRNNMNANSDGDYVPKIVCEAGLVTYNIQKKPKEQQLLWQPTTQLQSDIVNNDIDHIVPSSTLINASALNDEGYVTPTNHGQNSLLTSKNYYQSDVSNGATLQDKDPVWNRYKNLNLPTISQPSNLMSHQKFSCKTNSELITGDSYRMAELTLENLSLSKTQEKLTLYDCNTSLNKSFLFHQINSVEGITILFHMDNDGWILLHEFMKTFTKFDRCSHLEALLASMNATIREVRRSDYPIIFLQLDSYPLNVARDAENRIISIKLISLQVALRLLCKLEMISREEIDNTFKRPDISIDNPVMFNMRILIVKYKNFRRRIELSADYINMDRT